MAVVLRAEPGHNALMRKEPLERENYSELKKINKNRAHLHHLDKTIDSSSLFLETVPQNETYFENYGY